MRYGRRATILAAAVMGVGLGATQAMGQTRTWVANPTDGNWTTADNWSGTTVPGNTEGTATNEQANFGASGTTTVIVDEGRTIGWMEFLSTTSSYTFTGGTLNLGPRVSGGIATIAALAPAEGQPNRTFTFNMPLNLTATTAYSPAAGHTFIFNGDITAAGNFTQTAGGTTIVNGSMSGAGAWSGSGNPGTANTILNNANTNAGGITGGRYELAHAGAVTNAPININTGGHILVTADNAITGSGPISIKNSAVNTASLVINNPNDYTGQTTLDSPNAATVGPTLLVNNSSGSATGSGHVLLWAGLLAGDGAIINSGSGKGVVLHKKGNGNYTQLSPGAAPGQVGTLTLSLGALGLNISGTVGDAGTGAMLFDLGTEASSDRVDLLAGTLNIGNGVLEFDDFAFNPLSGFGVGEYTLFATNAAISGSLGANLSGLIGGYTGTIGLGDGGQDIILTVVPEPTALAGLGLAMLGLVARRRRI